MSLSEDDADDDISTSLSLSSESLDTGLVRQSRPRPSKPFKHRLRKNKNSALANSINNIDDDGSQEGCNNPFDCPPKFKAAGRRPRVKSNLRARKRNFWQKNSVNREFGVGHGIRRGRKIRAGERSIGKFEK